MSPIPPPYSAPRTIAPASAPSDQNGICTSRMTPKYENGTSLYENPRLDEKVGLSGTPKGNSTPDGLWSDLMRSREGYIVMNGYNLDSPP